MRAKKGHRWGSCRLGGGGRAALVYSGGTISKPSCEALSRTRVSVLTTTSSGTECRRSSALARCTASSVRTGSTGNACSARDATSDEISSTAHRAEACASVARTSAASVSVRPARTTARRIARWLSTSVSREQMTLGDARRISRISSPRGSLKSHRRTALVSA